MADQVHLEASAARFFSRSSAVGQQHERRVLLRDLAVGAGDRLPQSSAAACAFCFICDQMALTPAVWQATSTARSRASPMVSLTTRQTSRKAPVGSTPCLDVLEDAR